jgi:hypothetical protein
MSEPISFDNNGVIIPEKPYIEIITKVTPVKDLVCYFRGNDASGCDSLTEEGYCVYKYCPCDRR